MRRLRLTVGYFGTRYAGWEIQSASSARDRPTVRGTLELALQQVLGHPTRVTAAGRTDTGVHAERQVVSVDTTSTVPAEGLRRALEQYLPPDLWLVEVSDAASDFDARRAVRRRWYRYAVWRQSVPSLDWQGRCLVQCAPLDVEAMRTAARMLLGRHDFAAFGARPQATQSTSRIVFAADWLEAGAHLLTFEICADAFLKHMVRAIVGSLMWVGTAHWTPEHFATLLTTADRRAAGPNAPAAGLTLHRIEY